MLAGNVGRFPATARAFPVALLLATLVVAFLHFSSYTSYEYKLNPISPSRPVEGENSDPAPQTASTSISSTLSPTSASPAAAAPTWTGPAAYVKSIMDPNDKSLDRLECPRPDSDRYSYLITSNRTVSRRDAEPELKWLFAIDLRSVEDLLPRLLGSAVEVANFLGPEDSFISIIEGNSNDRTLQILAELAPALSEAGISYSLTHDSLVPSKGSRVQRLAALRNRALLPVTDPSSGHDFAKDADVIFLNDVAICPDDILELVHQRRQLGATLVCPFDWTYVGANPTFYDVWIARTLQGDLFFDIPPDGSWDAAWNLFWNDEASRSRFHGHRPFQVFSCWNGAVVFPASIVTGRDAVRFRSTRQDECTQGEPELFCKDLWLRGNGRIAVVPSVHLEYSNDAGKKIKAEKGYVNQWTKNEKVEENKIEWSIAPPDQVRCLPGDYKNQPWKPWNEGFQTI